MGYTYILQCSDKTYYVGSTNNLKRRLQQHQQGKCKYTKSRKPFKLVFSKKFKTLKKARSFEYFIKRQRDKKFYQKLITGKFEFK